MREQPPLSPKDLTQLIDSLYSRDSQRRSHLFAVLGTGEATLLATKAGEFQVVPVRSEIELRQALPPIEGGKDTVRRVFLVPWDTLPLDISGRFAGRGRVQTLPRISLLRTRLNIAEADPQISESKLADFLLKTPHRPLGLVGRATTDDLWLAWLETTWGTPRDLNLPGMLAWAASDRHGASFTAALDTPDAAGVREELRALLERRLGTLGPLLWSAWERGVGGTLLAFAVLVEALEGVDKPIATMFIGQIAKLPLGTVESATIAEVREQLRGRVALALSALEVDGANTVLMVLREAERLISDNQRETIGPLLYGSPRLETSWQLRLDRLGEAMLNLLDQSGKPEDKLQALQALRERLQAVKRHKRCSKEDALAVARQAEMAARLAAWLIDRRDLRLSEGPSAHAPVESLGRWYTEEGGYIDLARRAARPAATQPTGFGQAVKTVLERADEARRVLDLRFARALVEWYSAGRPGSEVLPIDRAVDRFVVDFLKKDERRLLVLLLDGMAWAQTVELLASLAEQTTPWAPIAWMTNRVGGAFPPIIAGAPSLTDVSRSAFFAGKPMTPGKKHRTGDDPKRWQMHAGLARLLPTAQVPRLYLGAESHQTDGTLKPALREQIERSDERVIALVLNVIDESLKVDPQQEHTWRVDSIRSLPALLYAARMSGRAVLLASDHGHVVSDRLEKPKKTRRSGGSRWRPLDSSGFDPSFEVALSSPNVWKGRGDDGIVLLADDQHSYSSRRDWGAHGGATLAEVIAPLLMIGWEGMDRELKDDDAEQTYSLRSCVVPAWWRLDIVKTAKTKTRTKRSKRSQSTPTNQVTLAGIATPSPQPSDQTTPIATAQAAATAPQSPSAPLSATTKALAKSADFKALASGSKYHDPVLHAVDYLLSRQGLAPIEAFADALGIKRWRVQQTITRYTEFLNIDGEPVLHYDHKAGQVGLDCERLAMVFDIQVP